ncbi:Eukaryotic translation initiation factor 4B [Coemansia sp. RSA 1933]|nr:Eukaryotic translation initiation factor 4B [Coemansia sp. RSA 1933]
MPAKKKSSKGVKMSLNDFLSDTPSTMSWADEEVVLPSAPMAASSSGGGSYMLSLDNAPDRKEYMAMRRDQEQQRGGPMHRDPVPFPTEPPFTAFVGNLPLDTDESQVREMFGPASGIRSVRLIRNRETDRLKGFGYVEFETADALKSAVAKDGSELGGRPLRIDVSEARDHYERPEDPLANTSNWRRAGAGPVESPGSPFASRSSSGYGRPGGFDRSASSGGRGGFDRSSSGFGRAPREPAPPTVADEDIDWRAHKNPPPVMSPPRSAAHPPAAAVSGDGSTTPRRTFTGDRFSRSSSGAGEARDEPMNWRRDNAREPRRPRDRSASREPRASVGDQEPSWRTAKKPEEQPPVSSEDADSKRPAETKPAEAPETEEGWNQVEKQPAVRRTDASGASSGPRKGDLRSPPRSTERRNGGGGGSFFNRQNREGAEDAGNWRRA